MPTYVWQLSLTLLVLSVTICKDRLCCEAIAAMAGPRLGDERIVFQTNFGDLEMALYPDVGCCVVVLKFTVHSKFDTVQAGICR